MAGAILPKSSAVLAFSQLLVAPCNFLIVFTCATCRMIRRVYRSPVHCLYYVIVDRISKWTSIAARSLLLYRGMESKIPKKPSVTRSARHAPYPEHRSSKAPGIRHQSTPSTEPSTVSIVPETCEDESARSSPDTTTKAEAVYPCISARQPYAGFILDGLKTIETRWTPAFREVAGQTVAIHVAWKDWEGGEEWRALLRGDHSDEEIEGLVRRGERHGRTAVAGLVDVGETWQCPEDVPAETMQEWEKDALLRPLTDKFLTRLSNPRWLRWPVRVRGQKGVWEVNIPPDCL